MDRVKLFFKCAVGKILKPCVGLSAGKPDRVCVEFQRNGQPSFCHPKVCRFGVRLMVARLSFRLVYNVLGLGEEADLEALNFQASIKVDSRKNVRLITDPVFLPNACYMRFFFPAFIL